MVDAFKPEQTAEATTISPAPVSEAPKAPVSVPQEDIITRVSAFSPEQDPVQENGSVDFNRQAHEQALAKLDPETRAQVEAYEKSIFTGANKKFQEAAELRKQAEAQLNRRWSPSEVQELLNNPDFRQSAEFLTREQQAKQPSSESLSEEQWSALTPEERQQLQATKDETKQLKSQMGLILKQKEDEALRSRYKNYNPQEVDQVTQDLLAGRIQATREHIWKILDYENAVKRGVEMAKRELAGEVAEKHQAASISKPFNVTPQSEVPAKNPKESNIEYFKRLANRRIEQSKK